MRPRLSAAESYKRAAASARQAEQQGDHELAAAMHKVAHAHGLKAGRNAKNLARAHGPAPTGNPVEAQRQLFARRMAEHAKPAAAGAAPRKAPAAPAAAPPPDATAQKVARLKAFAEGARAKAATEAARAKTKAAREKERAKVQVARERARAQVAKARAQSKAAREKARAQVQATRAKAQAARDKKRGKQIATQPTKILRLSPEQAAALRAPEGKVSRLRAFMQGARARLSSMLQRGKRGGSYYVGKGGQKIYIGK